MSLFKSNIPHVIEQAKRHNLTLYLHSDGYRFVTRRQPPGPIWECYKVDPDGKVWHHDGGTEHHWLPVQPPDWDFVP